jgi:hypothetical protein
MNRRFDEAFRAWSTGILLLVATIVLVFFVWNMILHGIAVKEDPAFRAWAERLFLVLWFALAFSLLLEIGSTLQEELKRRELPPIRGDSSVRERSFRTAGQGRALIRHCTGQMDKHFRRYYAFHHYQAPFLAYFYHGKKGSLSLLGLPWMKTGFLLLFLLMATYVEREGGTDLHGWEWTLLGSGCLFVVAGLLVRVAAPYRKVWLRIVEENNRICLTLSCSGRSGDRWFEALCRSIETQSGVVSCSTQSR